MPKCPWCGDEVSIEKWSAHIDSHKDPTYDRKLIQESRNKHGSPPQGIDPEMVLFVRCLAKKLTPLPSPGEYPSGSKGAIANTLKVRIEIEQKFYEVLLGKKGRDDFISYATQPWNVDRYKFWQIFNDCLEGFHDDEEKKLRKKLGKAFDIFLSSGGKSGNGEFESATYRSNFRSSTSRKSFFTPLEDTTEVEDVDDGEVIEGFTYADAETIEELGFPCYFVESRRTLKEKYGYDYPHQFLRVPIETYYSYRSRKDRRYIRYKEYSFKNLAMLGFTFRFFKKMLFNYVEFINRLYRDAIQSKSPDMKRYCQKELRLVRSDLRSTRDQQLLELARMIRLKNRCGKEL